MDLGELARRYLLMTLGLFVMNVGIALSTRTDLGTTPISSIPYVLNMYTGMSLGTLTFIFNCLLVLLQYVLLREDFGVRHLIQIPVTFVFSVFTDLCMWLEQDISPDTYLMRWILTILSVAILALGIAITIVSKASMMPGEGAPLAISIVVHSDYSKLKVVWDISLICIASILSLILFTGELKGVREGTIFAGIFVGIFVRYILKAFKTLFPSLQKDVS